MTRRKPTAREDRNLIKKILETGINPKNCTTPILNKRLMDLEAATALALNRASVTKGKDLIVFLNLALESITAKVALLKKLNVI